MVNKITAKLPASEQFKLVSQANRAASSIALNIAEGSTGNSDPEQDRFIGYAQRSYLETISSIDLIEMLNYLPSSEIDPARDQGHILFIKLCALRKALRK